MRVPTAARRNDRRRRVAPEPHDHMAGARPGGDSAEHGCALNLGKRRVIERQRVGGLVVVKRAFEIDAAAAAEPHDSPTKRGEQTRHLDVGRAWCTHRSRRTRRRASSSATAATTLRSCAIRWPRICAPRWRTRFIELTLGDGHPLDRSEYERSFGRSFDADFGASLARLRAAGLIRDDGRHIEITETGALVYDLLNLAFYPQRSRQWLDERQLRNASEDPA
jgi:hypothetical protein